MSYSIKLSLIAIICFACHSGVIAQVDSIIEVSGIYYYSPKIVSKKLFFTFVENGTTCGPNAQFESLDEQYSYFLYDLVDDDDIRSRIKHVDRFKNHFSSQPKRTYSFEYNDIEEVKKVYYWSIEGFAENHQFYSIVEEDELADQDSYAIEALEDATKNARRIAELRGFENVELLSIDDNTGTLIGIRADYRENKLVTNFLAQKAKERAYKIKASYRLY